MSQQEHEVPRETFIALRARREAYGIASEILYEAPIDVRTVACSGCGAWIDVKASTVTDPLTCPTCNARTPLPPYLRARYRSRNWDLPRTPLGYMSSENPADWMIDDEPAPALPRWLIWFSVLLAALLVGVTAALIAR